jgi:HAE1 family hydrophobic/amphiphilic exporter-1
MFSVPLAAGGGFLGLKLVSLHVEHQNLDVLTMLGFIILIGIVVNNAILIVHQALNYIRGEGEAPREAVRHSVKVRVRPIFMSTLTSVFGMLPLVLFTGPGSELYRGIGSVVVGGLVLSTVFTLFLVPALFSLLMDLRGLLVRKTDSVIKKPA